MHAGKLAAPLFAALLVGTLAMAQADTAGLPALAPVAGAMPASPAGYHLAIGDTIGIVVAGEETFTRECQVNGTGTISYPKLGDVAAAGLTCEELRTRLEEGLRTYLKHPHVMATVRQYGQTGMSVFVMGEVAKPGPYPLANGAGFMQALAAAGGPTEAASGEITVLKGRTGQTTTFLLSDTVGAGGPAAGVTLEPGDVILALRKREARYAVLGEVPRQGMFDMPVRGEVRMLDALQQAGVLVPSGTGPGGKVQDLLNDPARSADFEHARLTRAGADLPVNVASLLRGDTTQNLLLHAGDVLTVPRRPMVRVFAVGEVRTAGVQTLPENSTVLDLLNAAGGPTTSARPSRATLVRLAGGKPEPHPINVGDLLGKGDMAQNMTLQEGDVLVIPPQKNPDVTIGNVLSALSLLTRVPW